MRFRAKCDNDREAARAECYAAMEYEGVIDAGSMLADACAGWRAALCCTMVERAPQRFSKMWRCGMRRERGAGSSRGGRDAVWGNFGIRG